LSGWTLPYSDGGPFKDRDWAWRCGFAEGFDGGPMVARWKLLGA
jgi:hypothetical protein